MSKLKFRVLTGNGAQFKDYYTNNKERGLQKAATLISDYNSRYCHPKAQHLMETHYTVIIYESALQAGYERGEYMECERTIVRL